jgi:hypothetical protein
MIVVAVSFFAVSAYYFFVMVDDHLFVPVPV